MYRSTLIKAAIVITAMTTAGAALSHSGASGVVKDRMDVMSKIAKSMKTIGAMMKGEAAFDAGVVKASAKEIAMHSKHIPHLFPKGSTQKPSEALPAIWTDWDTFLKLAEDMETSAGALAAASEGAADAGKVGPQFGALAKTCKACHSDFRLAK